MFVIVLDATIVRLSIAVIAALIIVVVLLLYAPYSFDNVLRDIGKLMDCGSPGCF